MTTSDYDYELDYDTVCRECDQSPTHWRYCSNIHCDDGYIDEYENDAINFVPGEVLVKCGDCKGTGIESWCPSCGLDITKHEEE